MYDQESYYDIDTLLASLEKHQCEAEHVHPTTDNTHTQPRFIDVYIIDHTDEEAIPIIDSTLDTPMEQATPQQEEEQEPQ